MCSDTLNPGGEVQICSVGCILGMPEIPSFLFIVAARRYMGFEELKKRFLKRGRFGCGGISCFFLFRTSTTAGTCPFVSHVVSKLIKVLFPDAWMANEKGAAEGVS